MSNCLNHRDRSIQIQSALQLHDVKMTTDESLYKDLTSADIKNFKALIKKQLNLRYADVKLVF